MAELAQVLERVRLIKGIRNTETSIHLETYRARLSKGKRAWPA